MSNYRHTIKNRNGVVVDFFTDEIYVEMVTALGLITLAGTMPKKMEAGLKQAYLFSGTVKSTYLYINGIEITDGLDHNPLHAL